MLLLLVSKRSSCSLHCSTIIELVSFRIASIQLDTDSGGSRPEIRGEGGRTQKKVFFSALWASVWSKNKRGGAHPVDPPLTTDKYVFKNLCYARAPACLANVFIYSRADKCWAVKRALRSSFNVWCGVGLARALFPRFQCAWGPAKFSFLQTRNFIFFL